MIELEIMESKSQNQASIFCYELLKDSETDLVFLYHVRLLTSAIS